MSHGFTLEDLKAAYDAGFYRTEPDEQRQEGWPWRGKTCKDCVFWFSSSCAKHHEYRSPTSPTCAHFTLPDPEKE